MNTILKFSGTSIACLLLVAGTISANADAGRDDIAAATAGAVTKSMGTQVALNPQPLPPGYKSRGAATKSKALNPQPLPPGYKSRGAATKSKALSPQPLPPGFKSGGGTVKVQRQQRY